VLISMATKASATVDLSSARSGARRFSAMPIGADI
jgi:hypothetical protein